MEALLDTGHAKDGPPARTLFRASLRHVWCQVGAVGVSEEGSADLAPLGRDAISDRRGCVVRGRRPDGGVYLGFIERLGGE